MKKLMMAVMVAAIGLSATAAYTPSFAYQGVLRGEYGEVLTGKDNALITFKVYKNSAGTDFLWSKDITVALDTNGLFNVELSGAGTSSDGDSTTLDKVAADNSNEDLYVGLTVQGSSGEISPRQKLLPAPRALFAQDVKTAQGDFTVKGDLAVDGAISMSSTNDTLSVANIWATGTFYAQNAAQFGGDTEISGILTVDNDATIGGNLTVKGDNLTVGGSMLSTPIGTIIMWAGQPSNLPKDGCWHLCDGEGTVVINGVSTQIPDLRGRFVVGAVRGDDSSSTSVTVQDASVSYKVGDKGGENNHKLTSNEMPSHTHKLGKWDYVQADNNDDFMFVTPAWGNINNNSSDRGDWEGYTQSAGSDQPHNNLPPYYALCYLIKIK